MVINILAYIAPEAGLDISYIRILTMTISMSCNTVLREVPSHAFR